MAGDVGDLGAIDDGNCQSTGSFAPILQALLLLMVLVLRPPSRSSREASSRETGAATVAWACVAFLLFDDDDDPRFERPGCNRSTRVNVSDACLV